MSDELETQRLSKIMASRGLCSRREAERIIADKRVYVNGECISEQGVKFPLDVEIKIKNIEKSFLADQIVILLHKPMGYVSHLPQGTQKTAAELITEENAIHKKDFEVIQDKNLKVLDFAVAGRLDRASRGALILTNHGKVVRNLTSNKDEFTKEYHVKLNKQVEDDVITKLNGTVYLSGQKLKPMQVSKIEDSVLKFVLSEGKKHQIRRVCRNIGYEVTDLYRTKISDLSLKGLKKGQWRLLSENEVKIISQ